MPSGHPGSTCITIGNSTGVDVGNSIFSYQVRCIVHNPILKICAHTLPVRPLANRVELQGNGESTINTFPYHLIRIVNNKTSHRTSLVHPHYRYACVRSQKDQRLHLFPCHVCFLRPGIGLPPNLYSPSGFPSEKQTMQSRRLDPSTFSPCVSS